EHRRGEPLDRPPGEAAVPELPVDPGAELLLPPDLEVVLHPEGAGVYVPRRGQGDALRLAALIEFRVLILAGIHLEQRRDAGHARVGVGPPPIAPVEPRELELEEVPRRPGPLPG